MGYALLVQPNDVLSHYEGLSGGKVEPFGTGLVNRTFLVRAGSERFVLQWVNPVFAPAIHENIRAVTGRLARAGLPTPVLVPTREGKLCVDPGEGAGGGVCRVMTFVEGSSFERATSAAQVRAAARLVARFHDALDGIEHAFLGMRKGAHDTAAHLRALDGAVAAHTGHRLRAEVSALASDMALAAAALPPLPDAPARVCHGDLKLNNVLFAGPAPPHSERAVCLIDLDTVGPLALAYELGDALRSWCNRAGEDAPESELDLLLVAAAVDGYARARARALGASERQALLLGPEWVSLALAARFAADALNESYFGWDRARFARPGEHNLVRAHGQLSLHRAFVASRAARERMLAR